MTTPAAPSSAIKELMGLVVRAGSDDITSEDLRLLLQQRVDVVDQALRDIMQPDLPGVSISERFSIIDGAKSLVTRKVAMERLCVRLGDGVPDFAFIHTAPPALGKYLTAHPGSTICTFVMAVTGEVWVYIVKEAFTPARPDRVDYALGQVISKESASDFNAALVKYANSLASRAVNFELQARLLHQIGSFVLPALAGLGLADRLVLIPHRLLHILPLHAMFVQSGTKTFYLDELYHSVTYASSLHERLFGGGRDLPRVYPGESQALKEEPTEPPNESNRLLAVLDTARDDLPWVTFEAGYYHLLQQQGIPFDIVTSKEPVPPDLKGYRMVHWSGHGCSDPTRWGGSSLSFSGELFRALEIARNWDLSCAGWVTLAACETALHTADLDSTDEYCGLDLAFRIAGATSVFATMWSVSDATAAIGSLMINTSLFLGGATPGQVLAGVQHGFREGTWKRIVRTAPKASMDPALRDEVEEKIKKLLSLPDDAFASPKHWAVFRCFGP